LKEELNKARSVIREQNEELKEWRMEGAKMVSTGLPAEGTEAAGKLAIGAPATATAEEKSTATAVKTPSTVAATLLPVDGVTPFPPPPALPHAVTSDPAFLGWLRMVFERLQSLERRRREAEKVTAETVAKGRLAELNLIQIYQENERLQTQLDVFQRRAVTGAK